MNLVGAQRTKALEWLTNLALDNNTNPDNATVMLNTLWSNLDVSDAEYQRIESEWDAQQTLITDAKKISLETQAAAEGGTINW